MFLNKGKTLPQQYRIDKQPVPVDEIFRHQRMSGGGAAKNQDIAARAVLELVNFIAQIATDDFRISVIFLQQSFRPAPLCGRIYTSVNARDHAGWHRAHRQPGWPVRFHHLEGRTPHITRVSVCWIPFLHVFK